MTKTYQVTIDHCIDCPYKSRTIIGNEFCGLLWTNERIDEKTPYTGVLTNCPLPDAPKYPIEKLMNDCGFEIYFEGSRIGIRGHGVVYFPETSEVRDD